MGDQVMVGDLWRDRDSRMSGRVVRVDEIKGEHVYYRSRYFTGQGPRHRSKLVRFVKAFALVEVAAPSPDGLAKPTERSGS